MLGWVERRFGPCRLSVAPSVLPEPGDTGRFNFPVIEEAAAMVTRLWARVDA